MSGASDMKAIAAAAKKHGWPKSTWKTVNGSIAVSVSNCPYCQGEHLFLSLSDVKSAKEIHYVI